MWSYSCPWHQKVWSGRTESSNVMTTIKYDSIHRSKNRFIPLQWTKVLAKHIVLCYIIFTFSPQLILLYIGIISISLPNLCSFSQSQTILVPPKLPKNEAKTKSPESFVSTNDSGLLHAADGGRTRTLSPERDFKSLVSANFTTAAQTRLTKSCCPLA